jgi:hypothetical protein
MRQLTLQDGLEISATRAHVSTNSSLYATRACSIIEKLPSEGELHVRLIVTLPTQDIHTCA